MTGMMSFSEYELNELRRLRDNGEPLEPEELRAVNRKELFDRNRKPEPTASEPMPEPVAEPTPDTTIATKLLNGELMDIKANYSKDAK